jgi:riboflavin synthase alpha subunit
LERTYPWPHDDQCYRRTVVEGWIRGDFTVAREASEHRITLSDCDGKSLEVLKPLGSIALDGSSYLIGTMDGYEFWREVVIELGDTPRVVAEGHGRGW